ncbi:MAG: FecR family protein [Geminicoccaceae bacterium]
MLTVRSAGFLEIDDTADVVVTTGSDGRVSVILGDGSTVDLGPDSRLSFVRLTALEDGSISDIEMKLESGSAATFFPSAEANPGRFLLWTKPAVTSVRGTVFRVAVDDGGECPHRGGGGVDFAASGEAVRVPLNYGSAADYGQPPVPLRPLLAAPTCPACPKSSRVSRRRSVSPGRRGASLSCGDRTRRSRQQRHPRQAGGCRRRRRDRPARQQLSTACPGGGRSWREYRAAQPIEIDARPIVPAPMREGRFPKRRSVRAA